MPIDSMYLSQLLGGTFCICDNKQFVVSVFSLTPAAFC